jgi:hypothetical protein
VNVTSEEGKGSGVLVGGGVSVKVGVGEGGVAVGMAAWVPAIIVEAPAAIVPCRSIASAVGAACAPQALRMSVTTSSLVRFKKYFMWISP